MSARCPHCGSDLGALTRLAEAHRLIIAYAAALEIEKAKPDAHAGLFGNPADDAHDRLLDYGYRNRPHPADSKPT